MGGHLHYVARSAKVISEISGEDLAEENRFQFDSQYSLQEVTRPRQSYVP